MADETGKAIKLTRDDLRLIDVGKTKTFYLPDAKACDNGKALTYQFQNLNFNSIKVRLERHMIEVKQIAKPISIP